MDEYDRSKIEFWREITSRSCKECGGSGVMSKDDGRSSLKICKCLRLARQMAKMNDPVYGLHPAFHSISLSDLKNLTRPCRAKVEKFLSSFKVSKNPYKNMYIEGSQMGSGKSAIAALFYKSIMIREYDVSIIEFSELVALSRMMMTNSQAFNAREGFYHFLKEEEFLIIEDVDNRGASKGGEKLGYTLLDDLFSYRAKHPKRATIITTKIQFEKFTPSILGGSYYYSIFKNSIKGEHIRSLQLKVSSSDK